MKRQVNGSNAVLLLPSKENAAQGTQPLAAFFIAAMMQLSLLRMPLLAHHQSQQAMTA
jgi:hypothetical protein